MELLRSAQGGPMAIQLGPQLPNRASHSRSAVHHSIAPLHTAPRSRTPGTCTMQWPLALLMGRGRGWLASQLSYQRPSGISTSSALQCLLRKPRQGSMPPLEESLGAFKSHSAQNHPSASYGCLGMDFSW